MSWWKPKPSKEKTMVDNALVELEHVRGKRREALKQLVQGLDDVPVDDGLDFVGKEIMRERKTDGGR
jgi:hypothetical protein